MFASPKHLFESSQLLFDRLFVFENSDSNTILGIKGKIADCLFREVISLTAMMYSDLSKEGHYKSLIP